MNKRTISDSQWVWNPLNEHGYASFRFAADLKNFQRIPQRSHNQKFFIGTKGDNGCISARRFWHVPKVIVKTEL